jgi:DNA-directed RNA polymerase subunit RPC12/RpoP
MKYICLKCGAEFNVDLVARCSECGEMMDLKPLHAYTKTTKSNGGEYGVASKYIEFAEARLEKGDEVKRSFSGKFEGERGHLLMSKKKLLFVSEKGFINKEYNLLLEIPYDKIDEVKKESDYKLELRDEEDTEHEFNADIPVTHVINKINKFMN